MRKRQIETSSAATAMRWKLLPQVGRTAADSDARALQCTSMTDRNAVTAFMANVVVWPGSPTDPGYVNLHYSMLDKKNPNGKKIVTGWPTRTVEDLVQKTARALSTNYIKDLWFCTSLQSQAGKNSKGNPKAVRGATFAMKQKSIWVDIDVEPNNPKKYGTIEEALAAILLFAKTVGLPNPSALVFSGNGVHVYWISKDGLTPEEWAPYASGLKSLLLANAVRCDAGLTTDIARILRVPGTLNHKSVPPKPVQLSPTPLVMYDFETTLGFLKQFAAPVASPAKAPQSVFADGITDAQRASFSQPPVFQINEPGLEAGIDKFGDTLLKAEPIFDGCGFLREARANGGADYENPLWNLSVLCSTFMENGNAIAHEISRGYASYTHAETQQHFERKIAERKERGLGWPSCATIQSNGSTACAACPLLGKVKSPLQLGTMRPKPNQGEGYTQQPPNSGNESPYSEDEWPDGYSKGGAPLKGYANTLAAFRKLGIKFTLDTFRQKEFSEGHEIEMLNGELSDRTVTMLRDQIRRECGFYPDKETVREAITAECLRNRTNPVVAYFDGLTWDRTERLPKLLYKYLGAEDTPLNAAISVKLMCAIVRRSKQPGCKYDHEVVLQSDQGVRKSMFCEDLAVFADLFTDAGDLAGSIKEQMEIAQGKQIIEFPELAGFNQNSRERNKGYLSRRVDRARLAYAHYAKDEPRSSVPIGTTNPGGYLNDPLGSGATGTPP
jgi:Virulence-associated protein E